MDFLLCICCSFFPSLSPRCFVGGFILWCVKYGMMLITSMNINDSKYVAQSTYNAMTLSAMLLPYDNITARACQKQCGIGDTGERMPDEERKSCMHQYRNRESQIGSE